MTPDELHRFLDKTDRPRRRAWEDATPGCWTWTASRFTDGRGRFYYRGQVVSAARVAFEHWVRPLAQGEEVGVTCGNRACAHARAGRGSAFGSGVCSASPASRPSPSPTIAAYAAMPVMVVYCDGTRRELMSDREVSDLRAAIPDWPIRCFADYGWCAACQIAWQSAHP